MTDKQDTRRVTTARGTRLFGLGAGFNKLTISIALAFGTVPIQAYAQETAVQVSIPAQSLSNALIQLGEQASLQIFYLPETVRGLSAPAIAGRLTPDQALQRLLAGTGIQFKRNGKNVSLSRPASATAELPAIIVTGQADSVAEQLNPPTTVGSKIPVAQREIPQTVRVITQKQIQEQNLTTISDVLKHSPGVTVLLNEPAATSGGAFIYSRGFQITNYNLDGVPTSIDNGVGLPATNMAIYDRVELLQGPAGLYNGLGGAGGTINMVRKQPGKDYAFNGLLGAGSRDSYEGQIDVTGPLNEAGTLRGRAVGSWQRTGDVANTTYDKNATFYGILEADLSENTTAQVGASHEANWGRPDVYSFPTYSNGKQYDGRRSTFFGSSWNRYTTDITTVFANLEHHFGNGWTSKIAGTYIDTKPHLLAEMSGSTINLSTGQVQGFARNRENDNQQQAYDAYVTGPFSLFGRTHQLTFGANYTKIIGQNSVQGTLTNYYVPTSFGSSEPPVFGTATKWNSDTENYGVYANARFSLADPLTLVLGGRLSWYNSENTLGSASQINNKVAPFAGLVYDINDTYSVYASYSTIFQPTTITDSSGHTLKPLEGDQYELGIKGEYLEGRVNTSLALFKGTQKNRAVLDPSDPSGMYYVSGGDARVQGVDAQISGEVVPHWTVSAGYTYVNSQVFDNNVQGTNFSQIAPRHLFKLWTDYRLPGTYNKWSIGGGVIAQSSTSATSQGLDIRSAGYAIADARIGYQLDKNLQLALNVTNIFNRYYFPLVGAATGGNRIGDPRTVMLTLRASY